MEAAQQPQIPNSQPQTVNPNNRFMLNSILKGVGGTSATPGYNHNMGNFMGGFTQPMQQPPKTNIGSMSMFAYPATGAIPSGPMGQ